MGAGSIGCSGGAGAIDIRHSVRSQLRCSSHGGFALTASTATAINGKIYVIGGCDWSTYLSTNEEYDPVLDTWVTKTEMPTNRSWHAAAAVNDKIYVIGGEGASASTLITNQEFDPGAERLYFIHQKD